MDWIEVAAKLKFDDKIPWPQMPHEVRKATGDNVTYDQVRGALRRHPRYGKDKQTKGNIEYTDKRKVTADDLSEFRNTLLAHQHALQDLDIKQTEATVEIKDTKPIAIAFTADWHIGGYGVDHDKLFEDNKIIAVTDGLYTAIPGDFKDNYLGQIRGTAHEQIVRPGLQDKLVLDEIYKLRHKLIAACSGCHDTWDLKEGDKDFMETVADYGDCVHLWHGGHLYINLGTSTYHVDMRHKSKGESDLNTTNVHRRAIDKDGHADMVVRAHKHYPDMHQTIRHGMDTIYIRCGAYKFLDNFGQQINGYAGAYGVPVIVLLPDHKEMVPFKDFERGIEYLGRVRNLSEV